MVFWVWNRRAGNCTAIFLYVIMPYRIWKDAYPIGDFMKLNSGRACKRKCKKCNKAWAATKTAQIHVLYEWDKGEREKMKTKEICDACASQYK